MTLFSDKTLVVSLPAAEMEEAHIPAAVMTREQVSTLPVSEALLCAISLIESHCDLRAIEMVYVVRPEIFTQGISASWLRKRIGDGRRHLCITDGSSVHQIEGTDTYIFFYRTAYLESSKALYRLVRRAPEMLSRITGQVNTAFRSKTSFTTSQPRSIYLDRLTMQKAPPPLLYPFRSGSSSLFQIDATGLLATRPSLLATEDIDVQVKYILLTDTGLHDRSFMHSVARHIREACFDSEQLLLIRVPSQQNGESLPICFERITAAFAHSMIVLPRGIPPNIFFLASDLPASTKISHLSIVLHESFEFWRYPRRFYESVNSIQVEGAFSDQTRVDVLPDDVSLVYGDRATRAWLDERGLAWQADRIAE